MFSGVCAAVDLESGTRHPVVMALPPVLVLPLRSVHGLEQSLALLFAETAQLRCGQRLLAVRMFEVLLLQLLRWLLDQPKEAGMLVGLIYGLSHPKLARALTALHENPGGEWARESMARAAGMSRSAFAAEFKLQVGSPPAEYLLQWRVSIAQSMLTSGASIKSASEKLWYASAASFSRAFAQAVGRSPRTWLQGRPP